jgi:hypothetical protein
VFRRIVFPLRLAALRLSDRPGRSGLLAAGIGAAAAVLALVLGGTLIAQDELAARALDRVPAGERTVAAVYADLGVSRQGKGLRTIEPAVDRALAGVMDEDPVRVVQYKLLQIDGAFVNLAALDGVDDWVHLRSGRQPKTCTPERCEVVRLEGEGPVPSRPGLRFVEVGEGTLTSAAPFGRLPGRDAARIGESFRPEEAPPFVLAEGFHELAQLPALASLYRTYAWVVPLGAADVRPWDVERFQAAVTRARSTLKVESPVLDVVAPTEELLAARAQGRLGAQRLLIVGGQAAVLVLAFALLAAAGMRREAELAWNRLVWRGARRWQLVLVFAAEATAAAVVGTAIGWAVGVGATALLADRAGAPAGEIIGHSVLGGAGLIAALSLAAASALVVLLGLRAVALPVGGRSISTLDVAALGAMATIVVVVARGDADADQISGDGTGALLLLLPGLVTFVVAVACARLLAPALRLLERGARGARASLRLAALSLARSPGRAAVAVTFFVASLGLGLFALVYRSTVEGGNRDRAAYQVPFDFLVREDLSPSNLVLPLDAAPVETYSSLAPGTRALPVIRRTGSIGAFGGSNRFTLLGLPSEELAQLDGWRDDFADQPRAELAARIGPAFPVSLQGPALPADATALSLPVSVVGGDIALVVDVATPSRRFLHLPLGVTRGRERLILRTRLPAEARGGTVVALSLGRAAPVESHAPEFTRVDGVIRFGPLAADMPQGSRRLVSDYGEWVGVNGATPLGDSAVRYLVNDAAERRFQPPQPTDGEAIPVIASPGIAEAAGAEGVVPLRVPGAVLRARVAAVAKRFPTLEGDFAVADRRLVFTALNALNPGAAIENEVWIAAANERASEEIADGLSRPPFDRLAVSSRRAVAGELEDDPLSRGSLLILGVGALGAAILALLGLLSLLRSDMRDDEGELLDLEAQGAGPSLLRRHLRLRAGLVAGLGLAGGLAAAAVLAVLVGGLVTVLADAQDAEPSLVVGVDSTTLAAACAVYVAAAALLVYAVTRRAPQ